MGSTGPFFWWMANLDLMVVCLGAALFASGIVIFIKEARASSVLSSLLSSILFTMLGVPYFAIQQQWHWTSLAGLAALIGFGSMTLALTAIQVANIVQRRALKSAEDWAGRPGLVPGGTTDQTPGG